MLVKTFSALGGKPHHFAYSVSVACLYFFVKLLKALLKAAHFGKQHISVIQKQLRAFTPTSRAPRETAIRVCCTSRTPMKRPIC